MMSEDVKERYLIQQQRYVAKMRNKRMRQQIKPKDTPILRTKLFWLTLVVILIFGIALFLDIFFSMSLKQGTWGDIIAKILALILTEFAFCKDLVELKNEPKYQKIRASITLKKLVKTFTEYLVAVGLVTWILVPTNYDTFSKFSQDWINIFKILVPMLIQGGITYLISDTTPAQDEWLID